MFVLLFILAAGYSIAFTLAANFAAATGEQINESGERKPKQKDLSTMNIGMLEDSQSESSGNSLSTSLQVTHFINFQHKKLIDFSSISQTEQ